MRTTTYGAAATCVLYMTTALTPTVAAAEPQGQDPAGIADIVVTAERRPQTIQKTPIAITAIDGSQLSRSGITDLVNAVERAPAVQIQKSNIGSAFYIRGVGSRGLSGETPISVFQDGIYQQQAEMIGVGFADLNRIEVLRGPQGTIYGRNANGGTINLITNDPELGRLGGAVMAQYGNYDALGLQGMVNIPLSETLALRIVGARNKHDGYLTNGLNDQNQDLGRAKLLWQPLPELRVLLSVERTEIDQDGPGNVILPTDRDNPWTAPDYSTLLTIPAFTPVYCSPQCQAFFTLKNTAYRGELSYDFGFATATFLTGIQRFQRSYGQPFSGLWEIDDLPVDQETYEARLNSASDAPIQWVVGVYVFDQDRAGEKKYNYSFGQYTDYAVYESHSRAVFGQATVPVSDVLRVTGGLRYTRDKFRRRDDIGVVDGTTGEITQQPTAGTLQSGSYGKLTYKIGAEYDVSPRSMLYAQHSTGIRSGGVDPAGGLYRPETIDAFELGSKNRFLGNRLQVNAAAYYYLYKGYQLSYYVYANGGSVPSFITSNVPGTTKIWGAEIEGQFSLTRNDRIDFSANYQKSKFGDAQITTSCTPAGVCTVTDLSGRSLPRTPKWTATLGYEHRFDLADNGSVTARVDGQYKSAYNVDLLTFANSRQSAYALLNGRLTYAAPDDAWTIGAYINNATNHPVIQQANTAGPQVYGVINDPRTYGVVFSAKF
ncbi:TonB-dependent receptor [Sphingobium lactosutens]|uniref:TonB-denpendent receptor n=1 Tax=Sphingobium lactosutens DS20 TaxID=1331060 RepID=T0H987_9SPHN|nr:TonB-dependent receptor [Sphingobium lactosutens]EQB12856.1 hypothetical protein RLDS_18955 [Sphingobium lactosutens DS20]